MENNELLIEIERLKAEFGNADEGKLRALESMIEQAAYERIYLKRLNETALVTGLVKVHPEDHRRQKTLPISSEIARHSAALTNIMDKLMKHLSVQAEEDDGDLDDYE